MRHFFIFFQKILLQCTTKYYLNLFFLKNTLTNVYNTTLYIYTYINIQNKLQIKIYKTLDLLNIYIYYFFLISLLLSNIIYISILFI